jgi:hypothetical protein
MPSPAVPDPASPPAPDPTEAALSRARQASHDGRFHEAIGICNDLLRNTPHCPPALALLGTLQAKVGDIVAGVASLERAVSLNNRVAGWHGNLSALYRALCRPEQAVQAGRAAVKLQPASSQHLITLALALLDTEDRKQVFGCLLRAVGINPKDPAAHLALGQMLLAQGEMQAGWNEYEWRNETEAGKRAPLPKLTSALWNGMKLDGRLLLIGDQGFGDTIQFARYIPLAAERCREVILGCAADLVPLLSKLPGLAACENRWDAVPPHAAHQRLSSLPFLFRTELETIPSPEPYLFADPARVEAWREKVGIAAGDDAIRVGLAWSGRPAHPNDRRRSLRLETLRPLAGIPNLRFVSVQKPVSDADRAVMPGFPGMEDLSDALTDFGETAALLANLDLLITIDTGVAHLAGALGRTAWVLLPRPSDWRWLLNRSDSPWYPSLRLFRQAAPGAWDAPMAQVEAALRTWVRPARSGVVERSRAAFAGRVAGAPRDVGAPVNAEAGGGDGSLQPLRSVRPGR